MYAEKTLSSIDVDVGATAAAAAAAAILAPLDADAILAPPVEVAPTAPNACE